MASTVLITGASQGIGWAIANQFARHGFNQEDTQQRRQQVEQTLQVPLVEKPEKVA